LPNPFYSQRAKPMSRKPLHNAKTPVIPDQAAAMEDQDKPVATGEERRKTTPPTGTATNLSALESGKG
jgi:hypothetical protein